MYYFINSEKDATIYLQQSTQNTGIDEILEVSKTYIGTVKDIAHTLIKFNTDRLTTLITSGAVTASAADIILYETDSSEVPTNYTLYAYPISQSWDMGIGTRFDDITLESVTWNNRQTSIPWLSGSYTAGTTGSINGSGGVWYTASAASQSFEYQSNDIEMNVLSPVLNWVNNIIPNEGFIIKFPTSNEVDSTDYGVLKFFSKETNTIYQPKLRIGWDDSVFETGSLTPLTETDIKITFKRLRTSYKKLSTPLIEVYGRALYPLKTYTNLYAYNDVEYLPETTYYQIKDVVSDEIIIPFSDYTKVSCNENGNYFKLNLENWELNREYSIEIKVNRNNEIQYFTDDDLSFVVET